MRRLIVAALVLGCAQPGRPPGGPPDVQPPMLLRTTPDTNALNVRGNAIAFEFNEVVSERPQGPRSLEEAFIISPSFGPVGVSWRRTRVEVTPRGGLRPNTTYTVRLLPGMADLASNVDSSGATIVFSTGPTISTGAVRGRVFDWVAERPASGARVEAITMPDSAVWGTTADSLGAFALEHMPPGSYLLRAHVDANRNRFVDARELIDTITVALADSLRRDMLAAIRDSLGPGLSGVAPRDSAWLRVALDRPLDTLFRALPANFVVKKADSTEVTVAEVLTQADFERRSADTGRVQAIQDSVRQAAIADSIRVADSVAAASAPARPTGRRPGAPTRSPLAPAADTTTPPRPRPSAARPVTTLFVRLSELLTPQTTYRVRAQDLVGVTGATRASERVITTAAAPARPDTATPPDTGRRGR